MYIVCRYMYMCVYVVCINMYMIYTRRSTVFTTYIYTVVNCGNTIYTYTYYIHLYCGKYHIHIYACYTHVYGGKYHIHYIHTYLVQQIPLECFCMGICGSICTGTVVPFLCRNLQQYLYWYSGTVFGLQIEMSHFEETDYYQARQGQ